jgi:multiple sugar transport system permease protein
VTIPATRAEPAAPRTESPRKGGRGPRLRRFRQFNTRDWIILVAFLGIALLLDLAIIWGPTLTSIGLSFTSWNGIGSALDARVVGLDNYAALF